jgi:hypothetical protein
VKAIDAMAAAQEQLDALKTTEALPHEMTALNELLRAQAEIRRREVQRQQANGTGSGGSNRQTQDLSSLFDRELQRQQQTNYETPNSTETREQKSGNNDALDKIRELARRQEALNRDQDQLCEQQHVRGGNAPTARAADTRTDRAPTAGGGVDASIGAATAIESGLAVGPALGQVRGPSAREQPVQFAAERRTLRSAGVVERSG